MTSASDLARMVPGFDFLQGLMKTGGAGLPSIGQWIAPTLEPEELGKRIDELRTVQFWLEQNAKLMGTTIQALEVQRMTLATLKGMNMPLAELTEGLKIGSRWPLVDKAAAAPAPPPTALAKAGQAGGASGSPAVDPMQWWGALTQQFTELATKAMREGSADMARNLAGAMVKPGSEAVSNSIERAMAMPAKAAEMVAKVAKVAGVARVASSASATKGTKATRPIRSASAAATRAAAGGAKRRKV